MRLVETRFPHSTQDKHLFWIADLPPDNFPEGWRVAADERVPSVRTLHESYVRGVNYTCVVDGFILSPNIRQISVDAIDLEFRYSDHQPVVLVAELR